MGRLKCDICGRNDFKSQFGLTQHVQQVHGEKQVYEEPAPGDSGGRSSETPPEATRGMARTPARPGSLDVAIERLQVPMVPEAYNGEAEIYWEGFNKGVAYGANTILVGIRSAQELSSLGISQATPIIKMAQEMRQAEGQAAQEVAAQLAQATMQGNQQLMGAINNLAVSQPNAPNPMAQVMAETLKPVLQQVMQSLMGGLLGGFKLGQQPVPGQPVPDMTAQSQAAQPLSGDGWGAMPENVTPINTEEEIDV